MSDPIDEALKATAHAEASPDFSTQVRARIAAGDEDHGAWWPQVAAACAALALVAALGWLARPAPQPGSGPVRTSAGPAIAVPLPAPASRLAPGIDQPAVADTLGVGAARPLVRVGTMRSTRSDHDRALAPLSPLEGLSVPSIDPGAMVLGDQGVTPLAPIAPIPVVRDAVGDDQRGEL